MVLHDKTICTHFFKQSWRKSAKENGYQVGIISAKNHIQNKYSNSPPNITI